MVYNSDTVYKQNNNDIVNIKSLTNDWVNITDEFSLYRSSVYKENNITGALSDLNILFSKKMKIIYFDCSQEARILSNNEITSTGGWHVLLKYNGNRFILNPNGGSMQPTLMISPTGVNRGVILFQMARAQAGNNALCRAQYAQDADYSGVYGLAIRAFILDPIYPDYGIKIGQCVFEVEPT